MSDDFIFVSGDEVEDVKRGAAPVRMHRVAGADLDGAPEFICQVEIDHTVLLGEPYRDLRLGPIELRLRLQTLSTALSDDGAGASQVRS